MNTDAIQNNKTELAIMMGILFSAGSISHAHGEQSITQALKKGTAEIDLRLRYENVEQDTNDANALTLRTLLGYTTSSYKGFSAKVEVEDTRIVLGEGDYTVGPSGYNVGQYSVIADPEHTELDQGYVQYQSGGLIAKFGRQVITMDNHRFVGHVGWRQDRQTFDGVSVTYAASKALNLNYAYLSQRNRIFAQDADLDSQDHLINLSYHTSFGTFVGYSYLLEVDNETDNALDTFGASFNGSATFAKSTVLYGAEFATQSSETDTSDFDADYLMLEAGVKLSAVTIKLGYESLGSDNGQYGFATPLATLHKFNGWADVFLNTPAQGLVDVNVTVSGKLAGGGWSVVYHDFSADEDSSTVDDLGNEIDLSYVRKFAGGYATGIKYATYSGDSGIQDTDKLWLWGSASF
ncbi:alginate export family protein [Paraglaciecola polaris]|uniref:Alginate export domain-containing protein n=1 Tax=Paraglaciecola polaris LMG 21857 TaxID=1129793 RepID=K6Z907_9ALTE|nr:alginate export family protein [Paraglaciecola polaris]GAC32651.1 hypothetical protein GPLA_1741 [Paraglaciecola polaris LMG 21857]